MAVYFFVLINFVVMCKGIDVASLKLEQVLILSRHNVRTPLTAKLEQYSPQPWPTWNISAGHLTQKGALLETYMGKYIGEWLDNEDFLEACPENDEVLIYANTKPRTMESAKVFAESAFPSCNVTVKHYKNLSLFDPLFFPILHNKSEDYKKRVAEEMRKNLEELNLTQSYLELSRILNLEDSVICKQLFLCDLNLAMTEVVLEDGEEPNVSGPLYIGNEVVDSFIMSYYEGKPMHEVAWGKIKTPEQWLLLTEITKANQNIRFNLTTASKDLAGPLLKYMFDIFEKGRPKFTLLMGHDSNLNPVINSLEFKPFKLPHQIEPYPIGGKVVFQKWADKANEYLKVEYIYPTISQLRTGQPLSAAQPPQKVVLELKNCKITANGYCLWSNFMKLNVNNS